MRGLKNLVRCNVGKIPEIEPAVSWRFVAETVNPAGEGGLSFRLAET